MIFGVVRRRRAELHDLLARLSELAARNAPDRKRCRLWLQYFANLQTLKVLTKINVPNHERPACALDDEALAFEPLQGLA